jgi:nucleoside phosphorylase
MKKSRSRITIPDERWLVVSAWPPELARLEAALPGLPARVRRKVSQASVGVGLVEAAMNTTRLLAKQRPAALLLVGTAGVYPGPRRDLPLGSVAVIDKILLLPEILPGKHAFVPALMPSRMQSSPALIKALGRTTRLPSVDVACPLAITTSASAAATAAKLSGCALENLEAFAVARAAAAAGVPFTVILGIANHVGPHGHREWKLNAREAAAAACNAALVFLGEKEKKKPHPR